MHPDVKFETLSKGCKITRMPEDLGCEHVRQVAHLAAPPVSGLFVPFVHHDCIHNQLRSIHNRVCGQVPKCDDFGQFYLRLGMNIIIQNLPKTQQEPYGKFAEKYSGRKKAKYLAATDSLLDNGLTRKDAGITMFVKSEKMNPSKPNPDPRAIQFRDAKYCVYIASFLKPIEEHLYALKIHHPLMNGLRIIGKGLNQVERACLLQRKMETFDDPVVACLDASRFDKHYGEILLREEHRVYYKCCPDKEFREKLEWQLKNYCRTKSGIRYIAYGVRMSGDMNTALGNCLGMVGMVIGFMVPRGDHFDILDDGDDCLVILERRHSEDFLKDLQPFFLHYGMEMKIDKIAHYIEEVEWCQSSPIRTKHGYKFVRNPWKVMSCCLVGSRWIRAPKWLRLSYLAGLAECELVLNCGVPILQEYALALARNSHGAKIRHDETSGEWFRYLRESRLYRRAENGILDNEITEDARYSFFLAFEVTTEDQLLIESRLSTWNFSVEDDYQCEISWDPISWLNLRELKEFPPGY